MKHVIYWIIIIGLLCSFFWIEISRIFGITYEDTSLQTYITQDYPSMRESSDFWFNSVIQRSNIALLTDTTIDTNSGNFIWENKGKENTKIHFVFAHAVEKYTTLSLQSEDNLAFRLHHYLYKRNLNCNPANYPQRGNGDIHDHLRIDQLRNKLANTISQKEIVENEGLGGNCFLQGEIMPLGSSDYAGNNHYQLSLPQLSGLDTTYKIYTFYSINHSLEKESYTVDWKLGNNTRM